MQLDYVKASYLVFVLVLGWDYFVPRIKLARVRRMILMRVRREATRKQP
jgi:heme exporter protein D